MQVVVNGLSIPAHLANSCAFCGQPLAQQNAWHSTSGKFYCSEFCADDEEEAAS